MTQSEIVAFKANKEFKHILKQHVYHQGKREGMNNGFSVSFWVKRAIVHQIKKERISDAKDYASDKN